MKYLEELKEKNELLIKKLDQVNINKKNEDKVKLNNPKIIKENENECLIIEREEIYENEKLSIKSFDTDFEINFKENKECRDDKKYQKQIKNNIFNLEIRLKKAQSILDKKIIQKKSLLKNSAPLSIRLICLLSELERLNNFSANI